MLRSFCVFAKSSNYEEKGGGQIKVKEKNIENYSAV
jgi:hypothetical protein